MKRCGVAVHSHVCISSKCGGGEVELVCDVGGVEFEVEVEVTTVQHVQYCSGWVGRSSSCSEGRMY